MKNKRLTLRLAMILLLAFGLYIIVMAVSMSYVDKMSYKIHGNDNRSKVCHMLYLFKESNVSPADIPHEFRRKTYHGCTIFRYDFLGSKLLPIHVVYNKHNNVSQIVPTYE